LNAECCRHLEGFPEARSRLPPLQFADEADADTRAKREVLEPETTRTTRGAERCS
jgi:hypothetical protein